MLVTCLLFPPSYSTFKYTSGVGPPDAVSPGTEPSQVQVLHNVILER